MLTHYSTYPSHRLLTISAMASPAKHDNTVTGGPVGSVAVVGAGVSGLAAAYKLKSNGFNVTVFEAEPRVGGKIRSGSQDGFIWDEGANTMTETESEVGWLIDDIGLREKQQFPISQYKRYVAKNGIPEMLPSNPIALIKSNFLSTKAKFQILMEPFMWKKGVAKVTCEHSEESVGQFFQRHFGKEVVDLLIDPFLAGTNGGDPESLSMRHTFPELWKLESMFGSVIFGAIRSKFSHRSKGTNRTASGGKKVQRGSFSFLGGMDTLTNTLCSKLDDDELNLCSKVLSLSCDYDGNPLPESWSITSTSKNTNKKQHSSFDAVIMTAPISNVQDMSFTKGGNPLMLNFLPKVDYVPLSIIVTSFSKYKVKRPLEGFGVLVPSREQENGLRTLGTLFSSMMFPDRAPSNQHLYTTFIGGSRSRDLAGASLDELKQIVISDLQKLLGTEGQPTFVKHIYWKNAFPLYGHNYSLVLEGINKMEEALPGFYYAGNHRDGLSVGKAIASGCRAADNAISYILSRDNKQDTQKSE